ncbi:MAG TPA: bifunctional hydroxymethylpyrimidine kinase/phosphomethylpyrimidine kinase [Xanthobacteraceae bacterium]|nr:bifunctional hydroxymethylpyrimidine kinase/phosphomethylpyrimidine kinase [Xanthobacteraceae bacterium]
MTPIALTIAGSDSSGGAGIQADLKTFSALGVYGASVIAALTAQNTKGVSGIFDVAPEFVRAQMDAVYSDLDVGAAKIGMLGRAEVIEAVAEGLATYKAKNVVLDPVMVATSGDLLLRPDAVETLKKRLIPLALVVTPNLAEAAALSGEAPAQDEDVLARQGAAIMKLGAGSVLVKGGHFENAEATDILVDKNGIRRFTARRVDSKNTHGTGCTLSSAIAAALARGMPLVESIALAKKFVSEAIGASGEIKIGEGRGPVHHFHALWKKRED